ncbi:uncharacterized protein LOC124490262 isoform X3 [Dermatophagoides farinae]|uniref:uncharacterized protein LOC124490262 isoform X3 n=1 Tax=Dermatophagoides farinae TaxID=6954 RepID=UPI003F5E757C
MLIMNSIIIDDDDNDERRNLNRYRNHGQHQSDDDDDDNAMSICYCPSSSMAKYHQQRYNQSSSLLWPKSVRSTTAPTTIMIRPYNDNDNNNNNNKWNKMNYDDDDDEWITKYIATTIRCQSVKQQKHINCILLYRMIMSSSSLLFHMKSCISLFYMIMITMSMMMMAMANNNNTDTDTDNHPISSPSTMMMMDLASLSSNRTNVRPLSLPLQSSSSSSVSTTEYFYAQDKLSDAQVEQFLMALNQNITNTASTGTSAATAVSNNNRINGGGQSSSSSSLVRHHRPSSSSKMMMTIINGQHHINDHQHSLSLITPNNNNDFHVNNSQNHTKMDKNNITALRYSQPQQRPTSMINNHRLPDDADQQNDLSQWLRPVYIPPKRSSSSMIMMDPSSSSTTASNQTSSILLFGSDMMIMSSSNNTTTINSDDDDKLKNNNEKNLLSKSYGNILLRTNITFELKDEQWVAPIIALSTLNMLVIIAFECFVIYRACRTCPSRRHLFLGQMLLLGLFLCSAMGLTFVPKSSWLTCTMIRSGLGISFAIVYAALLVKTVFLLSLHQGVYLSAEYQALLLFFIIATQVAIDVQWLAFSRSTLVIDYWDGFGQAVYRCDHSTQHLLWSLCYIILLIAILAVMTFRIRGYRENHGEALFLGIVAILQIFVWFVWTTGTMTSTPHYRDGFTAFGIVANATMIFMIMFLPKGRQLAAVGGRSSGGHHFGVNGDDDDGSGGGGGNDGHHHAVMAGIPGIDQLSIGSSPSIYCGPQSFLHLKSGSLSGNMKASMMNNNKQSSYAYRTSIGTVIGGNHGHNNNNNRSSHGSITPGATAAYHHLYQKFNYNIHGTDTSLTTSPNDGGIGTTSTTLTANNSNNNNNNYQSRSMSNSFSSHAIFNANFQQIQQQQPNSMNEQKMKESTGNNDGDNNDNDISDDDDDDEDPNYSNLSNIFTTSTLAMTTTTTATTTATSSSNDDGCSKTSPISENNSNHDSSSASDHQTRAPSIPKTKRPTLMNGLQQQPIKSPNELQMMLIHDDNQVKLFLLLYLDKNILTTTR